MLALQHQALAERPEGGARLGPVLLAEHVDRLACQPDGGLPVTEQRLGAGALDLQHRQIVDGRPGSEELFGAVELISRARGVAARGHDPRAEDVSAGKVERVLRRLEQRDRAPDVTERRGGLPLHLGEPRERPVDADAHVGVVERLGGLERVMDDRFRAREVARVGERVAEHDPVPDLRRDVLRGQLRDLVEAALEQLDLPLEAADGAVGAAEREVDVDPLERRGTVERERFLEALDRRCVVARLVGGDGERDARTRGVLLVACPDGVLERVAQLILGSRGIVEPEHELGVPDAELPRLALVDVPARLEVVGRDAELPGELAEGLHRRLARARLDTGDVRVRDPGRGELALRQTPLRPQALQPLPDRLLASDRVVHAWRIMVAGLHIVKRLPLLDKRSPVRIPTSKRSPILSKGGVSMARYAQIMVLVVLAVLIAMMIADGPVGPG